MQIGFNTELGPKSLVIKEMRIKVEKEKLRFKKLCDEYQVHIGQGLPDKVTGRAEQLHRPAPIFDSTSSDLLDLVVDHVIEQLATVPDLIDDDDRAKMCAASFNITIHRPNPE